MVEKIKRSLERNLRSRGGTTGMKYLSVCSGIEAATVAWHPLGWKPIAFSEIEPFSRSVLTHHYPEVPMHGDFTTIKEHDYGRPDLLVGGTPCQSFSVAGLRRGFADDRGNLTLEFARLAQRLQPEWIVWENVPGVLSIDRGRAFGNLLGALAELGYGYAYRVLDAQYVRTCRHPRAVPQRRRRVFVVGHLGDWRRAAAVLFDTESLRGNPAPSRKTAKRTARDVNDRVTGCLLARDYKGVNTFDIEEGKYVYAIQEEMTIERNALRRFTPLECERLQGFPDNYTLVPHKEKLAKDSPRYKALGNSMAVNVMEWLGERIEKITKTKQKG